MTAFTQALRAAKIVTPLPDDTLALSRLVGEERLSTPFSYRIECISEDASLDLYKVLGHSDCKSRSTLISLLNDQRSISGQPPKKEH